jgi:hypothetical protein
MHLRLALILLFCSSAGIAQGKDLTVFRPVQIMVDPQGGPLAAYQIEFVIRGNAQIVGVEGGDHPAFNAAPYYDPAALNHGRIIIAAFTTDSDVPGTPTRVATLHVREDAASRPNYEVRLMTAASSDGTRIDAAVSLRIHEGEAP